MKRSADLKGMSPLISTVLLVGIVVLMAAVVGPWAMDIATDVSSNAGSNVNRDLVCRNTAYYFDTDYGNSGVAWSFNGTNGTVSSKIINTGSQNLYNFSVELTMQTDEGTKLIIYPDINVTEETQRTSSNPLKPGYEWIIEAEVANVNDTWSLREVKVINEVCPSVSPTAEI